MDIDFRAKNGAQELRPVVYATVLGITLEYPLETDFQDACKHLDGSQCPLSENEDVTYNFKFPIASYLPTVRVAVELSLIDEDKETVFCTIIDARVRNKQP